MIIQKSSNIPFYSDGEFRRMHQSSQHVYAFTNPEFLVFFYIKQNDGSYNVAIYKLL